MGRIRQTFLNIRRNFLKEKTEIADDPPHAAAPFSQAPIGALG